MATRYIDDFRRDTVRIAISSGLTRPQVSSDLSVGLSALNKWFQKYQHDDLMSGPHEDLEKENAHRHKEIRLLREKREVFEKATIFLPGVDEICFHRRLARRKACRISMSHHAGHIAWVLCLVGAPDEQASARLSLPL